ncbi:MAG: CTP synthase [Clostridia bacterium]|nr:CTP synthase [Clostridia bacterium]
MAKYIFVTGGVVSGLGKGITAATLGRLLKARGYKVSALKFNPYFNVDNTFMSPFQHGEIFVTEDGREADSVLGHYERIMDENLCSLNDVTSGEIYSAVIAKERENKYDGVAVQVVPHITNEIKLRVKEIGTSDVDIVIVEIGGTVGDIESHPYLEAIRQMKSDCGKNNVAYIHVTLVPYIDVSGEQKTKPTQHSVKELQNLGIQPDVIVCRSEYPLGASSKSKLSLFCNVDKDCIIQNLVSPHLYSLPLALENEGLAKAVIRKLNLEDREPDLATLSDLANKAEKTFNGDKKLTVALVGRHVDKYDAFLSMREALTLGGIVNGIRVEIKNINSDDLNDENISMLKEVDGVLIPSGFGAKDFENKQKAVEYCRINDIPTLMTGMGAQAGISEFAVNQVKIDVDKINPIIASEKDGQPFFKKGAYKTELKKGTLAHKIYGKSNITERHHHRRQINMAIADAVEKSGLIISGISSEGGIDAFELADKNFFVGVMFRPELTSRPEAPNKLIVAFIKACKK